MGKGLLCGVVENIIKLNSGNDYTTLNILKTSELYTLKVKCISIKLLFFKTVKNIFSLDLNI